jgi:hypothetical protein
MCFSATASFSSSVVIGALGVYSIKSVTHTHQKYLAVIPFLFAVQQFSEGFVWLTLNDQLSLKYQDFFTQSFLSFAWIIWPILVPLALCKFEFGGKGLPTANGNSTHPLWRKFGLFLCLKCRIIISKQTNNSVGALLCLKPYQKINTQSALHINRNLINKVKLFDLSFFIFIFNYLHYQLS